MTTVTVILDTPLTRGETTITSIELRKPDSGALRGTNLQDLIQLDVNALAKVLPRISTPTLTEADVFRLDPADLIQLGSEFAGFLAPKAALAQARSLSE
ncbi:phage tail assembly protein [Massilia dura]|uniref:Phage tail assembly protein n=1 Tax=Pseudoduganella dura TaxID=321982 RepID=A0A6I3XA58_9BURK|nr:phage tail assembly protein [Pseudoduganella dura]MUI10913.1 phage tail assembly protein [Pseudoduganella dura]GGY12827.1 hypothetical protein GCM10007386_48990 [Pseudoduganella dura]